jgi:hypothetical protein
MTSKVVWMCDIIIILKKEGRKLVMRLFNLEISLAHPHTLEQFLNGFVPFHSPTFTLPTQNFNFVSTHFNLNRVKEESAQVIGNEINECVWLRKWRREKGCHQTTSHTVTRGTKKMKRRQEE